MGISRAYPDTYHLLEILLGGDNYMLSVGLLYALMSNSFRVLVPQAVIGEAVSKLLVAYPDPYDFADGVRRLRDLLYKYRIDVAECVPPFDPRAIEIMSELRAVDELIAGNDLLILAQVLADPDSKFLFTRDSVLLNNEKLTEYERKLRARGARRAKLVITDTLRRSRPPPGRQ